MNSSATNLSSLTSDVSSAAPVTTKATASSGSRVRHSIAPTFLLTLLLIASAYLRFDGLDRESRWCDEYQQTGSYSISPWYVVLAARDAAQPPLDYLLGWAIYQIKPSLWAMRAPAAAFGIISIALTFLLAKRFAHWTTSLIAAGLVAFSPFHFQMSQTARPYTIFLAALLLMIWALVAALDQPHWRRLLLFGGSATLMTLTRGMAPSVVLLATAITLGIFALLVQDPRSRIGLRRAWVVTMTVGVIAAGVTAFLIAADRSWSVLSAAATSGLHGQSTIRTDQLIQNLQRWIDAPSLYFAGAAACVLVFAGVGAVCTIAAWRQIPIPGRVVMTLFTIAGPLFVLVYTVAVREWPLAPRYAFFLLPFVATLSSIGAIGFASLFAPRLGIHESSSRWIGLAAGVLLIATPAGATFIQSRSYSNPDWRGCAAYLRDRVSADEVIIVIQDRPVGEYQSTFWGKYEWPRSFDAPLAESAQTFVTSSSHWNRLLRQTGRCYLVIYHQVVGETADAYRQAGLQKAPIGATMTKFRGLDLLEFQTSNRGLVAVSEACRAALTIEMVHEDIRTIPKALITKIERKLTSP